MSSIGRNDLCPCGSGKKYKKCCSDNRTHTLLEVQQRRNTLYSDLEATTEELSDSDLYDLDCAANRLISEYFDDRSLQCLYCKDFLNGFCFGANLQSYDEILNCMMLKASHRKS